ncbi:MAG: DUF255 domain-containing protein [Chitinophagales bacterium]
MRHLLHIVLGIFTIPLLLQAESIDFQDRSWADVLKTAQQEKKYIFIDAYADYCLPCKAMEKETFSQNKVFHYFNQHFISYKMDIEADKNDYLVQVYQIKELPALLFLTPEGILLQKIIGKQDAIPLLQLGEKTLKNQWSVEQDESHISLDKLLTNLEDYKMQHGGRTVNWMVKKQVYTQVLQSAISKDIKLFQSVLSNASKANLPDIDRFKFNMQALFYEIVEDWQNYSTITSNYLNIKENSNPKQLNEIAWMYYLNIEDPQLLKKAIKWAEQSIKIESEYYNNRTYAALLYKIDETKKAYKIAERAIYMARARGIDDTEMINLIKKNTK